MKRTLLASLLTASVLSFVSVSAVAEPINFRVNEGAILNTPSNTFIANRIVGAYTEIFTVIPDFPGAFTGSFNTRGFYEFTSFNNGNSVIPSFIRGFFDPVNPNLTSPNYNIYAVFTAGGTFSGNVATFQQNPASNITIYLDERQDTTFEVDRDNPAFTINDGNGTPNDIILGTALLIGGEGGPDAVGDDNGSFSITFGNLILEDAGLAFFTEPRPFSVNLRTEGQFNEFDDAEPIQVLDGSADTTFQAVPEPGSLVLLGLGLTGLGLLMRRRKL